MSLKQLNELTNYNDIRFILFYTDANVIDKAVFIEHFKQDNNYLRFRFIRYFFTYTVVVVFS
jgi:hypothetical protein